MLLAYNKKYAVYDIGDDSLEWQVRAESSLFYTKFGDYETKADGMIMICDGGKRNIIAKKRGSERKFRVVRNLLSEPAEICKSI